MFDSDKIPECLQAQIEKEIALFKKMKNLDDKLKLSEIIKNLSQSHKAYIESITSMVETLGDLDTGLLDGFED